MTPPQVQLRPGSSSDFVAIVNLERSTANAPHWAPATYVTILGAEASPQRRLIVAEASGSIVGFAVGLLQPASDDAPCAAELESVAVAASARRAGIGRALCTAVIHWARSSGASEVILEVRATGAAAIALYSSLGFKQAGRRRRYYRDPSDDALIMRLPLLPPVTEYV